MDTRQVAFGRFSRIMIYKDKAYWQEAFGIIKNGDTIMMLPGGIGVGPFDGKGTSLDEAWDRLALIQAGR